MRAFRVAYDGRPFHGFQRQPDVRTVEGALFEALADLGVTDGDKPPGYAAAGRTDAGVAAIAQTVAFETPEWCGPAALNAELPGSVRAWASADAPGSFHATHDAESRAYTYYCHAPDADLTLAREALHAVVGTHDFHNLTSDDGDTTRTVYAATVERDGPFLVVFCRAGGFLRHLVRRIVTLVRSVATGAAPPERVDRVLSSTPLDGPEGVPPAPAYPLVLVDVAYPDLTFRFDDRAVESAHAVFEDRRVEHATLARVFDAIGSGFDG